MTILQILIWNILGPAALSAAAIASARGLGRGPTSAPRGRWGVAAGLGLGYLAGHCGLLGRPSFPTVEAKEVLAWLVLAATALGVVDACWPRPGPATWATRGAFVAASLALLLRSKLGAWGAWESSAWLLGLGAAVLASWWNLEAQAERLTGPGWVVPVGLVSAGWAAVQVMGRGLSLGLLEAALASTLLGALSTVGLRPGPALSKGGPAVAATALAGLGLAGYFYSEVPALPSLILAAAPWAPWVDRIGLIRKRSYWTRASVRFLAVLLAVGVAALVADAAQPDDGPAP